MYKTKTKIHLTITIWNCLHEKKKNRKKEKSNKNLKPFWQTNKIQANGGKKLFEKKNFFLFLSSFNER